MAVAESAVTRRVVERASSGERIRDLLFRSSLLLCLMVAVVFLGVLLIDVAADGVPLVSWEFISSFPSSSRIENSSPRRRSLSVPPWGAVAVAKGIQGSI